MTKDPGRMARLPYEFAIPESMMRIYWDEMSEEVVGFVDSSTIIWAVLRGPAEHEFKKGYP